MIVQTFWVLFGHAEWLSQQVHHGNRGAGWPLEFWQWWIFEFVNSLAAGTYGVLLIVLVTTWSYERRSDD